MTRLKPRSKKHVNLLFPTGASIPDDHPRPVGGRETARYKSLPDINDVAAAAVEIRAVVDAWCASCAEQAA